MEQTQEGNVIILAIIIVVILGCFSVLLFVIFLKRKNQVIKNKNEAAQLFKQELIKTQVEIQKETMKYIGREIHDNIGQKLTLVSLYVQQLEYENKAPQINDKINTISEVINQSLKELRQLSKSLTDDTIKNENLFDLLKKECKKIKELKQCFIHFRGDEKISINSYQKKSILFRITQEFLHNSIKHAKCKNISVSLQKMDNKIMLELKDDGIGFNIEKLNSKGIGLKNMQKRTELIGGIFSLESNKNLGTRLTIKIPI